MSFQLLNNGIQSMTERDVAGDRYKTTLTLRVNGVPFAKCTSDPGTHAEAEVCKFLRGAFSGHAGMAAKLSEAEQQYSHGSSTVTGAYDIFITRSPCTECTEKLIGVVNLLPEDKILRMFCATIYQGENNAQSISNIKRLETSKISVYRWDLQEMARQGDPDSLTVLQVANGVSFWDSEGDFNAHKLGTRTTAPNLSVLRKFTGALYSVK